MGCLLVGSNARDRVSTSNRIYHKVSRKFKLTHLIISHNFLLTHANKNAPYEDRTGAMGGAIVGYHEIRNSIVLFKPLFVWDMQI